MYINPTIKLISFTQDKYRTDDHGIDLRMNIISSVTHQAHNPMLLRRDYAVVLPEFLHKFLPYRDPQTTMKCTFEYYCMLQLFVNPQSRTRYR